MTTKSRFVSEKFLKPFNQPWAWEFSLWMMSSAAFGARLAVLLAYAGSPLPDLPYGVTLNALISTLSAFSTSTLIAVASSVIGQQKWIRLSRAKVSLSELALFDEASRGPLGSTILLAKTREWNLSSIAAIVTIVSLASTPFIQQSASIMLVSHQAAITSFSVRRLYYNDAKEYSSLSNMLMAQFYQGLYLGSLENGLASKLIQPPLECSIGNCTYETFQTLAVCSECADISSYITSNFTNNSPHQIELWSLPNGFNVSIEMTGDEVLQFGNLPRELRLVTETKFSPITLTAGYPIMNFTAFSPRSASLGEATAHECLLYWCINQYDSRVTEGIVDEQITATSKLGRSIYITDNYLYPENSPAYYEFPPIGRTIGTYAYRELHDSTKDSFLVGSGAAAVVTNFTSQILTGNVYTSNWTGPLSTNGGVARLYAATSRDGNQQYSAIFQAIATGLTSGLRSLNIDQGIGAGSNDGLEPIQGTESILIPSVRVSWGWIALPATLHFATFFVLCWSLLCSSNHSSPLWKSSILAAVFFGANMRDSLEEEIPTHLPDIERVAKEICVSNYLTQFGRPVKMRNSYWRHSLPGVIGSVFDTAAVVLRINRNTT